MSAKKKPARRKATPKQRDLAARVLALFTLAVALLVAAQLAHRP